MQGLRNNAVVLQDEYDLTKITVNLSGKRPYRSAWSWVPLVAVSHEVDCLLIAKYKDAFMKHSLEKVPEHKASKERGGPLG